MKKIISIILTIALLATLMIGCSKKEEEKTDESQTTMTEENNEQEQENNEAEETEEDEVEDLEYVLFLKDKTDPYLSDVKYSIKSDDLRLKDNSIEEIALEHLIAYGGFENLVSPIPEGTKLLGLEKQGSQITVDFSKEFVDNMKDGEYQTQVILAAIANTLTIFEGIDSVKFTIEGNAIKKLNGVDMEQEFEYTGEFFMDK